MKFILIISLHLFIFKSNAQQVIYKDLIGTWSISNKNDSTSWVKCTFLNYKQVRIVSRGSTDKQITDKIHPYNLITIKNGTILQIDFSNPDSQKKYLYFLMRKINNKTLKMQTQNSGNDKPSYWGPETSLNTAIFIKKM